METLLKNRRNPREQAVLVRTVIRNILHDQKAVAAHLAPLGITPKTFATWVEPALNHLEETATTGLKRGPKAKT